MNAGAWLEMYRSFWQKRFDPLDAYLRQLQVSKARRLGGNGRSSTQG
jgi:hypothetical protein